MDAKQLAYSLFTQTGQIGYYLLYKALGGTNEE